MNFDEFKRIFTTIYISQCNRTPLDSSYEQRVTIRMLDSLAHCEFDFDSRRVYVCPSRLVVLPTCGLPMAVLTGARSPSLVSKLKQAIKDMRGLAHLVRRQHKGYPILPEAIIVESTDLETLNETANNSVIAYKSGVAAWELINYASGIGELIKPSDFEEKPPLNWSSRIFSTKYMRFIKQAENQDEVKLVEYTNPVNQQRSHWLWEGKLAATVDRDWGRYMALEKHGCNILIYDKLRRCLSVPETIPLPRFFARALSLCSGFAPSKATINAHNELGFPPNLHVSVFSKVPPEIAGILGRKLSQEPIAHEIILNRNDEIL